MKPRLFSFLAAGFVILTPLTGHADNRQLSLEQLRMLDHQGCFTPAFKAAVHDLVKTRQALEQTKAEEKKLTQDLPNLQSQAAEAMAKVADLRRELAKYDHPEEIDFVALQGRMNDAGAKPEEQIAMAQAYVWAYATSPHQAEARQYLEQAQKKLADQQQAGKEAEEALATARAAARAKLLQRVQAKDLSLSEWRDFLRDMSQNDLLKYLGRPNALRGDYWIYSGDWTVDPITHQKAGLELDLNAGRVRSVATIPHA